MSLTGCSNGVNEKTPKETAGQFLPNRRETGTIGCTLLVPAETNSGRHVPPVWSCLWSVDVEEIDARPRGAGPGVLGGGVGVWYAR